MVQDTCPSIEEMRQLFMDPRYIIDEFIGAGAMACVYKVHERGTPNIYAVKILREQYRVHKSFIEIFKREAQNMRTLQYPNLVRFYKFVHEEHLTYILMDYVKGKPLTQVIQQARRTGKSIPISYIIRIMAQIARAINYLHDEGYIHRDIKLGNILVTENQSAHLTDLAIAGAFDAQESLAGAGTPLYMPYEQLIGQNIDHTVDIYAFAIMLFEMFTTQKPFLIPLPPRGLDIVEARKAMRELHQNAIVPSLIELRPELPNGIDEIFQQALAKNPSERYQDVMDFAQDIHELLKPMLPEDLKNFDDIRPQEISRQTIKDVAETSIAPKPKVLRRIFISYKSEELPDAEYVEKQLKTLGHTVWIDKNELRAGHKWWNQILSEIRSTDVVVALISERYLESLACVSELNYAIACNRQVLPVIMGNNVNITLIPTSIKEHQFVRNFIQSRAWVQNLDGRISGLEPQKLLNPLPDEPPVPMTDLDKLADLLQENNLSAEQQSHIYTTLQDYLEDTNSPKFADALQQAKQWLKRDMVLNGRTLKRIEKLVKDAEKKNNSWWNRFGG